MHAKKNAQLHGVFIKIFNIGVMLYGESGIGKSELALEFIKHGHSLIADDIIHFTKDGNKIIGSALKLNKNLLVINDIGIIDVRSLFGKQATISSCVLNLIINLEAKTKRKIDFPEQYSYTKILHQQICTLTLHINNLRNLYTLVEIAIKVYKLKVEHNYDAQERFFHKQQSELMHGNNRS